MQRKVKALINGLENIYGQNPWYGDSAESILKGIDPKNVFTKVSNKAHSIAELLSHIIGWREFMLRRISGEYDYNIGQDESFDWKNIDRSENTAWESLLKKLEENQSAILKILENKEDDFLDLPVPGKNYNMQFLIEGAVQHDIYHLGQISLLNKIISG